jgi:single-stranded-DNA-specific exonuclease
MNKWQIKTTDTESVGIMVKKSNLSSTCAKVLSARGINNIEKASEFFSCNDFRNPYEIKDMQKASEIILRSIDNDEMICIYGDYDCDGVTSTVILYSYLYEMGANVTYYIPEREEGYGMNKESIKKLSEMGVNLIITVDNGITAVDEAEYIKELGMNLIITDHHQPLDTLPSALAIVDVHQEDDISFFKYFCGAGIVFKLIAAMEDGDYTIAKEHFSEIAAIGTIGDVVSLTDENRLLVRTGLSYLENTERPGLVALKNNCGFENKELTSTSIAFTFVPRINAAGRFGSPKLAADLLLSESMQEAESKLKEINECNANRKKEEEVILNEIYEILNQNPSKLFRRTLVIAGKNWHAGVIGIVASRIMETYGKPCYIISIPDNGEARGSARAFSEYSVFESLKSCENILTRFGGHLSAGGFSLSSDKIDEFEDAIEKFASENYPVMPRFTLCADAVIMPEEIEVDNISCLSMLEPCGEGNEAPVFAVVHAVVERKIPLSENKHTKLKLRYGNKSIEALIFRKAVEDVFLNENDVCDLLVCADINEYNGKKSVSLIVKDYRKSGIKQSAYFASLDAYEKLKRDEPLEKNYYKALTPSYNELVAVYKSIPFNETDINTVFTVIAVNDNINYGKFRICIDIFSELELVDFNIATGVLKKLKAEKKVDLNSSLILNNLKSKENN